MYKIQNQFLLILSVVFCLCSCEQERDSLDLSQDVNITGFSVNGIPGTIDNELTEIKVSLPPHSDVTRVIPQITLPLGATVTPASGEAVNFSTPVEYTVTNGNRYNKYTVTVEAIKALITRFTLNDSYPGFIDQVNNKILVAVPTTTDVTTLTAAVEYTEGATLTPASGATIDFTSPVVFKLEYLGETFSYEVTVDKRDEAYAFVGTAPNMEALTNPDEKTAAQWMIGRVPNSQYISFDQIKAGSVNLNMFNVVWFHLDSQKSLPGIAADKAVIKAFKEYHQNGGNLLLSTFACLYVADLGISKNGGPNNTFGDDKPQALQEMWGVSIAGSENHPLFKGLQLATDTDYPVVYFLGLGTVRYNNSSVWNLNKEHGPYENSREKWSELTGGIPLAAFNWDKARREHVVISEFPRIEGGRGGVICIGSGAYDWYNENESPENSCLFNIEKITINAFEYLVNKEI